MSKLASLRIDLNKIDKSKIYQGEKGKYLTLTVSINDEKDQYGNDISAWIEQTKEEREKGEQKTFLGNGKVFWSGESTQNSVPKKNDSTEEDDLPF